MISENPIGIIELGNVNIKCLIFRINNANTIEILSTTATQSKGVHNGVVVNLANASQVIRSCISASEKKAKVSLKKINVVIEQPDFLCTKFSKFLYAIRESGNVMFFKNVSFSWWVLMLVITESSFAHIFTEPLFLLKILASAVPQAPAPITAIDLNPEKDALGLSFI